MEHFRAVCARTRDTVARNAKFNGSVERLFDVERRLGGNAVAALDASTLADLGEAAERALHALGDWRAASVTNRMKGHDADVESALAERGRCAILTATHGTGPVAVAVGSAAVLAERHRRAPSCAACGVAWDPLAPHGLATHVHAGRWSGRGATLLATCTCYLLPVTCHSQLATSIQGAR